MHLTLAPLVLANMVITKHIKGCATPRERALIPGIIWIFVKAVGWPHLIVRIALYVIMDLEDRKVFQQSAWIVQRLM